MKQTAVEWLVEQLIPEDQHEGIMDIIKEAKAMEKEQIIDFVDNLIVGMSREMIEQYYNKTFNLN